MIISQEDNLSLLTLYHVEPYDIGEYMVAVAEDETSAKAKLKVEVPPKVFLPSAYSSGSQIRIKAGDELTVTANVEGYPTPTIEWTVNEKNVKTLGADRVTILELDDKSTLMLRPLQKEDSGTVKVKVTNEVGEASVEFSIFVPDIPTGPLNLTASEITSSSAKLDWTPPADSHGSDITHYVVERKTAEYSRWRVVGRLGANETSYRATNLFSDEIYTFKVSAINEAGQGQASNPEDVITLKEDEEERDFTEAEEVYKPSSLEQEPEPTEKERSETHERVKSKSPEAMGTEGDKETEKRTTPEKELSIETAEAAPAEQKPVEQKLVAPMLEAATGEVVAHVDKPTEIVISVSGEPEPMISWTRNGKKLKRGKVLFENGQAKVVLDNTSAECAGDYTCTATNKAGSMDCTVRLTVQGIIVWLSFICLISGPASVQPQ